jgi:hypothetical protein
MKKTVVMLIAAVLLTAALVTDIIAQYQCCNLDTRSAYEQGKMDAIEQMEVCTVDLYNPYAPREFYIDGHQYDQIIYIELDGEIYPHGMYQG